MRLTRPTRTTARKLTNVVPIWSCSQWGLPCPYRCRDGGALLPHPFTLTGKPAVCFLWHFPWGRPRRVLPGTVLPWSPDFPLPLRAATIRPSGRPKVAIRRSTVNLVQKRFQQGLGFGVRNPIDLGGSEVPLKRCHDRLCCGVVHPVHDETVAIVFEILLKRPHGG